MSDTTSAQPSRPSLRRITGSILAGIVTVVLPIAGGAIVPWLSVGALFSPILGGAVAGFVARGGRTLGAGLGLVVGMTVAVGLFGGFVYLLVSTLPMTGGAPIAAAFLFFAVVIVGVLAVVFSGLGGLFGAVLRAELDRARRRPSAATTADGVADPRVADSREAGESTDGETGVRLDESVTVGDFDDSSIDDRPIDSVLDERTDSIPGDTPSTEPALADPDSRRPSLTNAVVGGGLSIVVVFVPGSPFFGGLVTGFLERSGWRRGLLLGAAAGVVATLLMSIVIGLFSVFVLFAAPGAFAELLLSVIVLSGVYFVVLSALGGAVGGAFSDAA